MKWPDRARLACAAVAAGGLVVRLLFLVRPVNAVDRWFVPDDAWYTLSVARSLARGLGPSVDGVRLTNGFQPLVAFLVTPVFWVSRDPDVALGAMQAICSVFDAVTAFLLAELARRASGDRAAVVAAALWSFAPTAVGNALDGLETSVAVTATAGAALAWGVACERATTRAWIGAGALLGVSLLARVDTVFFVALIGLATLRIGTRPLATLAASALAIVAPWWAWCLVRLGTIVPESGAAVREQALIHKESGVTFLNQLGWAASTSLGPLYADATDVREGLGSGAPALGAIVFVALVAGLAVASARASTSELRVLARASIAILAFYALVVPAVWFFRRYMAPVEAMVVIGIAIVVARARSRGAIGCAAVLVAASLAGDAWRLAVAPAGTADLGHNGAKGYRAPAKEILAEAPHGAVIGSLQSGALGYFADGTGVRVLNLDGVVDREAGRALREGKLAEFVRARGVTHFADWEMNAKTFLARAGDPRMSLVPIANVDAQGPDFRFTLYEIVWSQG
jgi:hypothetical protein